MVNVGNYTSTPYEPEAKHILKIVKRNGVSRA